MPGCQHMLQGRKGRGGRLRGYPPKSLGTPKMGGGRLREHGRLPGRIRYSQLFLVPKKDGGQRPVINSKKLNSFVKTKHFKMESIQTLKDLLKTGDWMGKVEFKYAYFTIPIATASHYISVTTCRNGFKFSVYSMYNRGVSLTPIFDFCGMWSLITNPVT